MSAVPFRLLAVSLATAGLVSLGSGCTSGGGSGSRVSISTAQPLVVTAGTETLKPEATDTLSSTVDLARLGLSGVDAVYELETPKDEPFAFHLVRRMTGNAGAIEIAVAHAAVGGKIPTGGPESLAAAGIVPQATGIATQGAWLEVTGDGFARLTLQGAVDEEQIFAIKTRSARGDETALIRLKIGARSAINLETQAAGTYSGVISQATLYSSNSWRFALPTVAVSGDRASVVVYEGDENDPRSANRYEMRLQYDALAGLVTGGGSSEPSEDSGNWCDHEIAALYNVLALATSGRDGIEVKLSFDRGATFGQTETLKVPGQAYRERLVQIAMAKDYALAILFWRGGQGGANELLLVEAEASAFDTHGSPTAYRFGAPTTIYRSEVDITPLVMGAAYSDGGDLVLGYGFTMTISNPDRTWVNHTEYRLAVRQWGESGFFDTLVEEDEITGMDPSVALTGQGAGLEIFYVYEARSGIRLRTSGDAGRSFSPALQLGDNSSHKPSIFVRDQGGKTRVDLLYLTYHGQGTELHLRHWDDYGATAWTDHRLTTATVSSSSSFTGPVPGAPIGIMPPSMGRRLTQIGWFGYDATLQGDDVYIVLDEQTYDAYIMCGGPGVPMALLAAAPGSGSGGGTAFTPAAPPPLAPGMTKILPTPDPDHMHQLKFIQLD